MTSEVEEKHNGHGHNGTKSLEKEFDTSPKYKTIEDKLEELHNRHEREGAGHHSEREVKVLAHHLLDELKHELWPGQSFKNIKSDLDRVESKFFELYDGKPVKKADREDAFNLVAKAYITALYDLVGEKQPIVDGSIWYGSLMKDWLSKIGSDAVDQAKGLVEDGKRAEVLALFSKAYEAQANKIPSIINRIKDLKSSERMVAYERLADILAGKKGEGDVAKVAENFEKAISSYAQLLGHWDTYKEKPHQHGAHWYTHRH